MSTRPAVGIIGAGMAGIYLASRLLERDYDVTLYEKHGDVGGTWLQNDYPGLHVDVLTRSYEFPERRSHTWSKRYAPGPEIENYLRDFARAKGVYPRVRFHTEVASVTFRAEGWDLETTTGETARHDIVVAATGFLRIPKKPRIPGMESFAGASFHSSEWDHSLRLDGKRIGVIGMGSSGIQIVSEMGRQRREVTHFVRTPQWIQLRDNPKITWLERTLLRIPALSRYWDARMVRMRAAHEGPETWRLEPGPDRDAVNARFHRDLEREIPDPVLREQLTPKEALGCKRIPKSPDYYRVVQQPNVHPVFGGIDHIEPDGLVDEHGTKHELDVIVYATGFDTHAYMRPMEVTGADGVTVEELWRDSVFSYRGVGLPGMPNLFLLNGPFAPINSLAIPLCLKDEVGYLLRLFEVIERDGTPLAPTHEATERFVDSIRKQLPNTTYSLCDNWYTDASGTQVLWPFTKAEHARQYEPLELADFQTFGSVRSRAG